MGTLSLVGSARITFSGMQLITKYAFFALIATITNILCQDAIHRLHLGHYDLYLSMSGGTLAGLWLKYLLDKKYIFFFKTHSRIQNGQKFVLYSLMGVLTTCLFWGIEIIFDFAFESIKMRYAGAVIGLGLGYAIKYRLDKRFVFVPSTEAKNFRVDALNSGG